MDPFFSAWVKTATLYITSKDKPTDKNKLYNQLVCSPSAEQACIPEVHYGHAVTFQCLHSSLSAHLQVLQVLSNNYHSICQNGLITWS